jgi:phage terminase large subunit
MEIEFDKELFNTAYINILHEKKRYIHLYGGAGSGKSIFAAQKEIIKSFEVNQRTLVMRKVHRTMKNSVFLVIKDIVSQWGLYDSFTFNRGDLSIVNNISGSEFILSGLDDPEKLKSIQGVTRIWIEEATELNAEDFQQIDLRLRGVEEPQITVSYNPINQHHWLYEQFHQKERDDTRILHTTYKDNRFIDEHYYKVLENLKNVDENYYNIYCLGKWGSASKGLIFRKWKIVDEVPGDCEWQAMGLDFGFSQDPTALISVHRKGDDIYLDENIYQTGLTNTDLIELMRAKISKSVEIYADSAEPKSITELQRSGFNIVGAEKGKDSIKHGIDVMCRFNLFVTSRSLNLIKEFNNYKWKEHKASGDILDKPIDAFNHGIDGIRYCLTMKLADKGSVLSWSIT